jgi:hypothetical protein
MKGRNSERAYTNFSELAGNLTNTERVIIFLAEGSKKGGMSHGMGITTLETIKGVGPF